MAEYQKPGDRLKEITDQLEKGLQDLFSSGQYADYLKTMSKFYDYSASNSLLIFMQRPDASHVAGYGAWQKNFNRHVKRGEHGIKILAPTPFKQMVEMEKIDPVTQRAMTGADGKPVTEVMEVTRAAFKPVTVFDVSQTEGEPLPQLGVNELTGDVEHYPEFFEALKQIAPFPIGFEPIGSGTKGYCNYQEQRIAIKEGMAEIQNVKTAIHEITHATLHNYYAEKEKNVLPENRKDQRTREVEAESVAYTVCQHYGIDTADYSFGYIAGWSSGRETKELKGSLATIRETAAGLITSIDEKYRELAKEQEQQKAAPAVEAPEQAEPDSFTIYQLKSDDDLRYHRFISMEALQKHGLSVENQNYDQIYTAPLTASDTLEGIYTRFNTDRPEDFKGHSLSVSDVVVLHQGGQDRAYYVDSFGYAEVPQFLEQQRAELTAEAPEPQAPVFPKLDPTRQEALADATKSMLQMLIDADLKLHGQVTCGTLEAVKVQGYAYNNGALEKLAVPEQAAPENPLAAAEMSTEQNTNMIDGLINNKPFMPDATMNERANALIDLVERDGQRFGDGERRMIVEYAEHVQDNQKLFSLVNELAEQGFEQKNGYVNYLVKQRVDAEISEAVNEQRKSGPLPPELDPAIQPVVTIIWSESDRLREGEQMTLAKADPLFQKLDAEHGDGYDKTKFSIAFTMHGELDTYEGRQDFGDGDGGLIQHIKAYHEYYAKDESWKNHVLNTDGAEAWENEVAQRDILLNEFIPYMQLHCNLSELERAGAEQLEMLRALPEPDALDQSKIAYYEAMQTYIDDCRHELNTATGEYHLPEMPKEQDAYTSELRAYQEQVREEVRQEAAAAGMTVEEYAANGYEPLSSFQPVQEQAGTPAMDAIEEKVKRGEAVSLMSMVEAAKTDRAAAKPEKKPSIKKQLEAGKSTPAKPRKPRTTKAEKEPTL